MDLYGQLLVTHVLIMGVITYLSMDQPGALTRGEKGFLVLGWLIPIVGPILAGILVSISKKRNR